MLDWQPGNTAPRDGRFILISHNRGTWVFPNDPARVTCVVVFWMDGSFHAFGPDSFSPESIEMWADFNAPPRFVGWS